MQISDGFLVSSAGETRLATIIPSVRHQALAKGGPEGVIWHYTAGVGGAGYARTLAERIQTYKKGVDRAASWHVVISKTGEIFQSVPFTRGAWHCRGQNSKFLGIELENAGRLKAAGGKFYAWPYYKAKSKTPDPKLEVPAARAVKSALGGTWDGFPPAQVEAARAVVAALKAWRPDWARTAFLHGHVDFDPGRREDPGPVWKYEILPGVV